MKNSDDGAGADLEDIPAKDWVMPCDGSPCTPDSYIKKLEAAAPAFRFLETKIRSKAAT